MARWLWHICGAPGCCQRPFAQYCWKVYLCCPKQRPPATRPATGCHDSILAGRRGMVVAKQAIRRSIHTDLTYRHIGTVCYRVVPAISACSAPPWFSGSSRRQSSSPVHASQIVIRNLVSWAVVSKQCRPSNGQRFADIRFKPTGAASKPFIALRLSRANGVSCGSVSSTGRARFWLFDIRRPSTLERHVLKRQR